MKNVVIDFSELDNFCGFGDIARNYAPQLAHLESPDLHFIFMVPDDKVGAYGTGVDYISMDHPREDLQRLGLKVDLWHATDQLYHYRMTGKDIIQVLTIHDLNFLYEKRQRVSRWKHLFRLWMKIRQSDALTFISQFAYNEVNDHYNLSKKTTRVIYNGITPLNKVKAVQPVFVKDKDEKFFFTIGQIRRKKNFHTLVPMMKYFPDYHLYICGDKQHPQYVKDIEQAIQDAAPDRIQLTGRISAENKKWLFEHCQGFLFPSLLEGFGIPVLEAMSLGAKVFSSRLTSLPEVCGRHAYYFDDFVPEHMAHVVEAGLRDHNRLLIDEEKAHARSFDYDSYVAEYIALYRKLLKLS